MFTEAAHAEGLKAKPRATPNTTFVPLFFFETCWRYGDFVGKDLVCDVWILEGNKRIENPSEK